MTYEDEKKLFLKFLNKYSSLPLGMTEYASMEIATGGIFKVRNEIFYDREVLNKIFENIFRPEMYGYLWKVPMIRTIRQLSKERIGLKESKDIIEKWALETDTVLFDMLNL